MRKLNIEEGLVQVSRQKSVSELSDRDGVQ